MKKLMLLYLFILSIGIVTALEFDNVKNYNMDTKTITIHNAFGLGKELISIQMVENTKECSANCYTIFKIKNYEKINIGNKFSNTFGWEFEDLRRNKLVNLDYSFHIAFGNITKPIFSWVECSPKKVGNGSDCITHFRNISLPDWENFDFRNNNLPIGEYYFKISGTKSMNDIIDHIPILIGEKLNEFAKWGIVNAYANFTFDKTTISASEIGEDTGTGNIGDVTPSGWTSLTQASGQCKTGLGNCLNMSIEDGSNNYNTQHENGIFAWWFYPEADTSTDQNQCFLGTDPAGNNKGDFFICVNNGDGSLYAQFNNGATTTTLTTAQTDFTAGKWYHAILKMNDTGLYWFINGNQSKNYPVNTGNIAYFGTGGTVQIAGHPAGDLNWRVDELKFFTTELSEADILNLYLTENGTESITISLDNPSNNSLYIDSSINFDVSLTPLNLELVNSSLFVWNTTALFNKTTNSVTGEVLNTTNYTVDGFTQNKYNWYIYSCAENSTADTVCFTSGNYTFNVTNIINRGESWANTTVSGAIERFEMNVTIIESLTLSSAFLRYNNTEYSGTITHRAGNNYSLIRNLEIEPVTVSTNITFNWSVNFTNGINHRFSANNISVSPLNIDNCSSFTDVILNMSLLDEDTQNKINMSLFNSNIEVNIELYATGGTTLKAQYNNSYNASQLGDYGQALVCLEAGTLTGNSYEMDAIIKYEGDNYSTEYYNFQNFTLTDDSTPQVINLYDLLEERATKFIITFKDEDFSFVEDALINIARLYVSDGLFRTVEIGKTDSNGQTIGHFVSEDEIYTITVTKYGRLLAIFSNVIAVCQDKVIEECKLPLSAVTSGIPITDFKTYANISFTFDFDETARRITVFFTTLDGNNKNVELNATKFDGYGNESVCSSMLISSSGTLTCNIPLSYGNVTIISDLSVEGNIIDTRIFSIKGNPKDIWQGTQIVMIILLFITIPFIFSGSHVGQLIGLIVGFIIAVILNLVNVGSYVGVGSSIIWLIIAIISVILALSRRGR